MAKSRRPEPPSSAQLTVAGMQAAIPKLERRIKELESFDLNTVRSRSEPILEALGRKADATLLEIFGPGTVEYQENSLDSLNTLPIVINSGPDHISDVVDGYRDGIERAVLRLRTIKDLFEERIADSQGAGSYRAPPSGRVGTGRVFVVHGHDEGAKAQAARFISSLSLDPIILHEQPNQGRTIIEKFEAHSSVDFAVILLTPDDEGRPLASTPTPRPRARQNVILELGFFLGALGRSRVCALQVGELEVPSDYGGVAYVPMDATGAWRLTLAREMKAAGLPIDLNKAM